MKSRTAKLTLCAIFAALSAILSQISIPIGTVPINLTHISIFTAAGLLGWKYGTFSQLTFVAMGAIGLPVFSGFSGGLGKIVGPTGGFIVGYIACALVTAVIINRFGSKLTTLVLAMTAGWLVTYTIGSIWFMIVMQSNLATALMTCVVPFLIGDVIKTAVSAILINRLRPIAAARFE